ncbi:MAG TPA: hypothetical protein VF690_10585, partial [Hymenobacter sp.]
MKKEEAVAGRPRTDSDDDQPAALVSPASFSPRAGACADVAIVILNWNGAGFLSRFLPGVLTHADGARVIVADNASTDNSVELLARDFPLVE